MNSWLWLAGDCDGGDTGGDVDDDTDDETIDDTDNRMMMKCFLATPMILRNCKYPPKAVAANTALAFILKTKECEQ